MITMKLPPGVTYRQLRYWVSQGYLPDELTAVRSVDWTDSQWNMLAAMGRLREAGVDAGVAGPIAQRIGIYPLGQEHDGLSRTMLRPGITLVIDLSAIREPRK